MISALNSAASGIRYGLALLDRSAANIARFTIDQPGREEGRATAPRGGGVEATTLPAEEGGGLAEDMVSMIIARHTVAMNAGVLRRADQTLGSLVDVLA